MKAVLKTWWGKTILVLLVLFLGSVAYFAYSVWQLNRIFPDNIAFDAALWKTADTGEQDNTRCSMQADLEQNHLNLGMTKAEVVALLGETEQTEQTLSYYLGFCNPFGIDGMALGLEFDSNDKLTKIYDIQY
jgi:predicted negative regulator of RcsB-dependent stress response